jgi:hypothetical protein
MYAAGFLVYIRCCIQRFYPVLTVGVLAAGVLQWDEVNTNIQQHPTVRVRHGSTQPVISPPPLGSAVRFQALGPVIRKITCLHVTAAGLSLVGQT